MTAQRQMVALLCRCTMRIPLLIILTATEAIQMELPAACVRLIYQLCFCGWRIPHYHWRPAAPASHARSHPAASNCRGLHAGALAAGLALPILKALHVHLQPHADDIR